MTGTSPSSTSKSTKRDASRQRWVDDTRMFQRIAGVPESTEEELAAEWETFNPKRRLREVESASTHRVIQDAAIAAGKERS